jgi:hypothetical protein
MVPTPRHPPPHLGTHRNTLPQTLHLTIDPTPCHRPHLVGADLGRDTDDSVPPVITTSHSHSLIYSIPVAMPNQESSGNRRDPVATKVGSYVVKAIASGKCPANKA